MIDPHTWGPADWAVIGLIGVGVVRFGLTLLVLALGYAGIALEAIFRMGK